MSGSLFSFVTKAADARRLVAGALVCGALMAGAIAPALAATTGKDALAKLNKDGDDTLEIVEVIELGTKAFTAADKDKSSNVDQTEAKESLKPEDWALVNKDGDQTLEMDEWLLIVRSHFNAADANKDGKLSESELDSAPGQALLLILYK